MNAGLKPEKYAALTTDYASYEEAVPYFVKLINLDSAEMRKHFPDRTVQIALLLKSGGE